MSVKWEDASCSGIQLLVAHDAVSRRYYDTGLSSVYLWDLDDGAFAGVVLFKKGEYGEVYHSLCE